MRHGLRGLCVEEAVGHPVRSGTEEVSALRRIMRLHLGLWGLHEIAEAAQLCATELVSNVITHVGAGTPTTLAVSMNGTYLRIEVQDPDTRALPTLIQAGADSKAGGAWLSSMPLPTAGVSNSTPTERSPGASCPPD